MRTGVIKSSVDAGVSFEGRLPIDHRDEDATAGKRRSSVNATGARYLNLYE